MASQRGLTICETSGVCLLHLKICAKCSLNCYRGFAPSDIFVLLSWSTGLYTELLKTNPDFPSTSPWRALIGTIAILLDLLLDSSSHAKPAVRKSSIARVRRALRSVWTGCLYRVIVGPDCFVESCEPVESDGYNPHERQVVFESSGDGTSARHVRRCYS